MADSTTIRVSRRTHETITSYARDSGLSADGAIAAAFEALDEERIRRQYEADARRLAGDPEDRAEVAAAIRDLLGE